MRALDSLTYREQGAVVGAGIAGLAAANALRRAGVAVRCFEQATPGHAETAGLTRIFRHAHGDPALVHLAMQARAGWDAWEQRYGRRLVGEEGLLITGLPLVPRWERALREAGAPYRYLEPTRAAAPCPSAGFLLVPSCGTRRVAPSGPSLYGRDDESR